MFLIRHVRKVHRNINQTEWTHPCQVASREFSDRYTGNLIRSPLQSSFKLAPEEIPKAISNAKTTKECLNSLAEDTLTDDIILLTFRALYKLQQNENTALSTKELRNHPTFKSFCSKLKHIRHQFTENDLIDLLDFMHKLGFPERDMSTYNMLLKLVNQCQLKDFKSKQIEDLYLTTRTIKRSRSSISKNQALFNGLMKSSETTLRGLNRYIDCPQRNESDAYENYLFPQCVAPDEIKDMIEAMYTSIESKKESTMDQLEAYNLIRAFASLPDFPFEYRDLWVKALSEAHMLLTMRGEREKRHAQEILQAAMAVFTKHPELRCYTFLSRIVMQTRMNNFASDIPLMMHFDRLKYCSEDFLRRLIANAELHAESVLQAPAPEISLFVKFLARTYSSPKNWQDVIAPRIGKNKMVLLNSPRHPNDWAWLEFAVDMAVLSGYNQTLLERAINKAILQVYACRCTDAKPYANILRLYQHHHCQPKPMDLDIDVGSFIPMAIEVCASNEFAQLPLRDQLETDYGQDFVVSAVLTKYGHCIQHVMIRDKNTMQFVRFDEERWKDNVGEHEEYLRLDNIICHDNEELVAINYTTDVYYKHDGIAELSGHSKMFRRQLEHLGLTVIQHSEASQHSLTDMLHTKPLPLK